MKNHKFFYQKETSSMKGLFLYLTDKQDEGQKLAKTVIISNFSKFNKNLGFDKKP